jgi:hypothetical protein
MHEMRDEKEKDEDEVKKAFFSMSKKIIFLCISFCANEKK